MSELSEYNASKTQNSAPLEFERPDQRHCHDPITEILDLHQIDNPLWAKKLYKQIALQTHPDKVQKLSLSNEEKLKREKIFKEAASYIQEEKYTDLIEIAQDLDVEIPIADELYLNIVEKSIREINSSLKGKKDFAPWLWGELNPDRNEKINFIFFVLAQLGEPSLPREVVECYLKCYEENGVNEWRKKYVIKQPLVNQRPRKRPGPSVGKIRRGKQDE